MKKITAVYFSPCGTTKTAVCSVAGGLGEMAKEADLTPLSAAGTNFSGRRRCSGLRRTVLWGQSTSNSAGTNQKPP